MTKTLFKIFFIFFVTSAAFAQDVNPEMTFDDSGYIDDLAGEHAPDMGVQVEAPELRELRAVKKIPKKKKVFNLGEAQSFQGKTYSTGGGISTLTILAIVAAVLLVIIGGLAYFFMVRNKLFK